MNRDDRVKLKRESNSFLGKSLSALIGYRDAVLGMREEEKEKLERLPESIRNSGKGASIEADVECLDRILELLETLDETYGRMEWADIAVAASAARGEERKGKLSPGRGGTHFHLILPEGMHGRLRMAAASEGVSMNELVCQILSERVGGGG